MARHFVFPTTFGGPPVRNSFFLDHPADHEVFDFAGLSEFEGSNFETHLPDSDAFGDVGPAQHAAISYSVSSADQAGGEPACDPMDVLPGTYTSGDPLVDDVFEYNVTINFSGEGWTDALKEDVIRASDLISYIVTGDVSDVELFGGSIDDIAIDANLTPIDGTDETLAVAGPTYIRAENALPFAGEIHFDIADAEDLDESGAWGELAVHEMLHVLGFGTLWDIFGLVDEYVFYDEDEDGIFYYWESHYNGPAGNDAFVNEFPDQDDGFGPLVESDGGFNSAGGHWDKEAFGNEIMTGSVGDESEYISNMTIASLEDLGYETIYGDDLLVG